MPPKNESFKKMTHGSCLPWRHQFLQLMSRLMLCLLQNDNKPYYKGKMLPKEGSGLWLLWSFVCNPTQMPRTSKGTTHLEYCNFRKFLKSQSERTLFPELCFPWFLCIPLEFTKALRHLEKKSHWINIE